MNREEAKHLSEVLKAYSEGKSIEQQVAIGKWEEVKDLEDNVAYEFAYSHCFRIKSEPKYRPYKNAEEFLKAQKEHGPYVTQNNINYYSFQRIVNTNDGGYVQFIQGEDKPLTFKAMLGNKYNWQDGAPCGIMEK